MINVTRPNLPSLEDFLPYLKQIWDSGVLSNGGKFHQELELALSEYLGLPHVSLVCNATVGLMLAQDALGIRGGEVITTPFSFVATSNSILWMQNKPVFVDIEPNSGCLDPRLIEAAITDETKAIMPLHCYGNMVDTAEVEALASRHDLAVIYDACHSFGVEDAGGSALRHGDISVVSFHATKVLNTFEGGLVVSSSADMKKHVDTAKNFGFTGEDEVTLVGINGKLNEVSAAFGLLQLQRFEEYISARAELDAVYRQRLAAVAGIECLGPVRQGKRNFAYFPVVVDSNFAVSRDVLADAMKARGVYCRKYFSPIIPKYLAYTGVGSLGSADSLQVAADLSSKILCLPIYPDLAVEQVHKIVDEIVSIGNAAA